VDAETPIQKFAEGPGYSTGTGAMEGIQEGVESHGPRCLNNLSAIYAENNLNNTNNSLQTVLQQLSSGSKINSGADDAAGLSLVNGLEANSSGADPVGDQRHRRV
jgi:hypothetical protein